MEHWLEGFSATWWVIFSTSKKKHVAQRKSQKVLNSSLFRNRLGVALAAQKYGLTSKLWFRLSTICCPMAGTQFSKYYFTFGFGIIHLENSKHLLHCFYLDFCNIFKYLTLIWFSQRHDTQQSHLTHMTFSSLVFVVTAILAVTSTVERSQSETAVSLSCCCWFIGFLTASHS